MGASKNLALARQAVKHVVGKMSLGAQNKPSDVLASWGQSLICVFAIRSVEVSGEDTTSVRGLRIWAAKAESAGCGNCGEQSAIAFVHLMDLKVRPLDYMIRTNKDHAFVVIGRESNSLSGLLPKS